MGQAVFHIPELLDRISGFCDPDTFASLRATCCLARSNSYRRIRSIHIDVPCRRWVLPLLAPVRHFHQLAILKLTLGKARTYGDIADAGDIITAVLYLTDKQPHSLVLRTGFDFGARTAQALASARTMGHTTIITHSATTAPMFWKPPAGVRGSRPSLGMQLVSVEGFALAGLCCLTSLTVSNHALPEGDGPWVDMMLCHFDSVVLPNLSTLQLTMPQNVHLDFTEFQDCELDLSQLETLHITGCTLEHPDLYGLAFLAPNLINLHLGTFSALGTPRWCPREPAADLMDLCWSGMTRLSLQLLGPTHHNHSYPAFQFPPSLTDLSLMAPSGAFLLPLRSDNFNHLAQLTSLRLQGIKFHRAFAVSSFGLFALRHVLLRDIHVSSSDYSFPAQQIGLRCPDISTISLRGRSRGTPWPHYLDSVGLLQQQVSRSATGSRLWPDVPLVISSGTAPNPTPGFTYVSVLLTRP
ncbi:hypothetical protein WJX74_010968 [Apatococcus lobatus]|uniref:F-box domain-containing protein n=1 Tax=Apatococcus lobatus TaxID=904363 RepID=A0AAW1R185_9CHLO